MLRYAVGCDGGGACGWAYDPLPGGCGHRPGGLPWPLCEELAGRRGMSKVWRGTDDEAMGRADP